MRTNYLVSLLLILSSFFWLSVPGIAAQRTISRGNQQNLANELGDSAIIVAQTSCDPNYDRYCPRS